MSIFTLSIDRDTYSSNPNLLNETQYTLMASRAVVFFSLFLVCVLISTGCVSPPSENGSQSGGKSTTKTTIQTPTVTPEQLPHYPLFKLGQIALKSDGASSGLAIVDVVHSIQMYGTKEVKKFKIGPIVGWYTEGEEIVTYKKISDVDKSYRFSEWGVDPAHIPITIPGREDSMRESEPCDALGDWNINDGSVYKLRYDGIVLKQKGNERYIGQWRQAKTPDKRTYFLKWSYGPGEGYPFYFEEIELSKDLLKFNGINNYGEKFTGSWAFTGGTIPSQKTCSDWPGGNDWYNK